MKNFSKIALFLMMLVVSLLVMASCQNGNGNIVDIPDSGSISVAEDGMPQLVYVVGEEIDLSNGVLTIDTGDEVKEIPLNSEGVTVSGYDKNKVGDQVVTITYGNHTTQITVTVVERMQAIEIVTDYLAGDALDLSKGRLKITRNDGTNYTVILGNEKVTLSGYDPAKVATQTVTATYDSGDGVYECKFDVTVHAVESIKFNPPKKVAYKSHENGQDLTGASFTLTGNGGALVREVAVTENMVSGFDLSAVTEENSPVTQKVTVTYDKKEYSYDVTLTYTDISLFKKNSSLFTNVDLGLDEDQEEPVMIDTELGELALEMMEIYLDLSMADRSYITDAECSDTAGVAMMYGYQIMDDDFISMEDAFIIYQGELYLTCESPEAMEKAIEKLEDYDNDIYRATPIIAGIILELTDLEVIEGVTFGEFGVLAEENYEEMIGLFEYMLDLHERFEKIGADWNEDVNKYAAEIQSTYNWISGSDYRNNEYFVEMCYYVATWRAEDDAFEILYNYYYGKNDMETLKVLSGIMLPKELNELATHIYNAIDQVNRIANLSQVDTSAFMYSYHEALKLAEKIKNSDNQMIKDLYSTLPVNAAFGIDDKTPVYFDGMLEYLRVMDGGYYQFSGSLLGIEEYKVLMQKYMDIMFKISTDDEENPVYDKSEEYGKDVEEMFEMYVDLTPTQQFCFIGALSPYYGMGMPPLVFDDESSTIDGVSFTNFFVSIVNEHYRSKLSDEGDAVYNKLVIAMELFAQRYTKENWVDDFTSRMDEIKVAYEKLSDEDKAYLETSYNKYIAIRGRFAIDTDTEANVETKPELGEWADEFEALKEAIMKVEIAGALVEYAAEQGAFPKYGLFFSAYEGARAISDYILENAPQEIIDAYYYSSIYNRDDMLSGMENEGSTEDGTETGGENTETEDTEAADRIFVSLEYIMGTYRALYINYQLTAMEGGSAYYIYNSGKLPEFYENAYYLIWDFMLSDDDTQTDVFDPSAPVFNKEKTMAAINLFRELSLDEQMLFILFEGDVPSYYYMAVSAFTQEICTDSAGSVAMKLVYLEQSVVTYKFESNAENLETIKSSLAAIEAEYIKLEGEDKASFAPFEEMYDYYVKLCNKYITEAEEIPDIAA